jgi:hypothetical protein
MSYRVIPHRLLTRTSTLRHCTRTMYYVVHGPSAQPAPLRSSRPFGTIEAARLHAKHLAQQGYAGWITRVHEYRQEDWPAKQWLIDHEQEEPIAGMHPF